jgi:putative PIN family toxin of toxin-antitoxin system
VTQVVIDPGVLVSAFISPKKAAPALLVDAFLDGKLDVLVSPALIAELTDVLGREKFSAHAAEGRSAAYIAALRDRATMVEDVPPGSPRTADADDYLIALAHAHGVDAVVSGDRHLLDACVERAVGAHTTRAGRSPGSRACRLMRLTQDLGQCSSDACKRQRLNAPEAMLSRCRVEVAAEAQPRR